MSFLRPLPLTALLVSLSLLSASSESIAQQKTLPSYTDTDAAQHVGEEAAITGKLVTVGKSAKGTTYLNFGDRFPRHTFSGTVLARDEAKVGDLKIYEGKIVTVTGKIELSLDQKPQILISAPAQIKLADVAASTGATPPTAANAPTSTAPVPVPPRAPMPGTVPAVPVPPSSQATTAALTPAVPATKPVALKKMALAPNWNSSPQGGEMTRKDLAALFGGSGSASTSLEGDPSIMIYPDVPFLAPLSLVKKRLQLENLSDSVSKVNCPGLPIGSFSAHGFTGVFAGGYNRLNVITDLADQAVSIQLVDENPRQRSSDVTDTNGYHTYNFINARSKGNPDLVVKHQIVKEGAATPGVVVVESLLLDPTDPEPGAKPKPRTSSSSSSSSTSSRTPHTAKVMERSRWQVPVPVVNLILRCIGGR